MRIAVAFLLGFGMAIAVVGGVVLHYHDRIEVLEARLNACTALCVPEKGRRFRRFIPY